MGILKQVYRDIIKDLNRTVKDANNSIDLLKKQVELLGDDRIIQNKRVEIKQTIQDTAEDIKKLTDIKNNQTVSNIIKAYSLIAHTQVKIREVKELIYELDENELLDKILR